MNLGDIFYANIDTRPLVAMVRGTGGSFFNFTSSTYDTLAMTAAAAGKPAALAAPFDATKYTLALAKDPVFAGFVSCVIPAAALVDPAATLIEAVASAVPGGIPAPTQTYWVGMPNVVQANARGSLTRYF